MTREEIMAKYQEPDYAKEEVVDDDPMMETPWITRKEALRGSFGSKGYTNMQDARQGYRWAKQYLKDTGLSGWRMRQLARDHMLINTDGSGPAFLTRRDAITQSMRPESKGYETRAQARFAYQNALSALRETGLRGDELRQTARRQISQINPSSEVALPPMTEVAEQTPAVEAQTPAATQQVPAAEVQATQTPAAQTQVPAAETQVSTAQTEVPAAQTQVTETPSIEQLPSSVVNDNMRFGEAFGAARKAGLKTFNWRGKSYGTKLASSKPATSSQTETVTPPAFDISNIFDGAQQGLMYDAVSGKYVPEGVDYTDWNGVYQYMMDVQRQKPHYAEPKPVTVDQYASYASTRLPEKYPYKKSGGIISLKRK